MSNSQNVAHKLDPGMQARRQQGHSALHFAANREMGATPIEPGATDLTPREGASRRGAWHPSGVQCYLWCIGHMLSKIKLLSMITQYLLNYFSSFTQHQYISNKSSIFYQVTIHTSTFSQLLLNFLPSQCWPKFSQSLIKTLMLVDD